MSADLLVELLAATAETQESALHAALRYAHRKEWIDGPTGLRAGAWLGAGAYLDAALVLVPKGYAGQILVGLGVAGHSAAVWDETTSGTRPAYEAKAATPALALVLAALKAREAGQ